MCSPVFSTSSVVTIAPVRVLVLHVVAETLRLGVVGLAVEGEVEVVLDVVVAR